MQWEQLHRPYPPVCFRVQGYYDSADHLYLSILTEVFRNRTYAWWRKRIKLKSSLFISCAAEVAQLIYYKMKQRA